MAAGAIEKAVRSDLRGLKATSSAEGQVAIAVARRLDASATPATAAASLARELRELLAELRDREKPEEVSPLDEIRQRRAARLSGSEDPRRSRRRAAS